MRKNGIQNGLVASLCLALMVGLSGCASDGGGSTNSNAGSSDSSTSTSGATRTIPASSPIARVENGMTDSEVRSILGEPGGTRSYPSFAAFLPWANNGWRVAWLYPNVGRVVFSQNRWSGSLAVVDRQHNPNETK